MRGFFTRFMLSLGMVVIVLVVLQLWSTFCTWIGGTTGTVVFMSVPLLLFLALFSYAMGEDEPKEPTEQ